MRIGELAATVGVTTRAVRHYHHQGLLPEPQRLSNGYRNYTLRHAIALARIGRLTELGLGLAEIKDVLAEDAGKDLVEVLTELDDDLARQEAALRDRRTRLRALLADGSLPAEGPVSPELAAAYAELAPLSDSPMAVRDREVLALLETAAGPEERARIMAAIGSVARSPESVAGANEAYALLDALADAALDDPLIDEAARRLVDFIPPELLPEADDFDHDHSFLRALYADFAPAQAEAVRRALRIITEAGQP
ncbi:MerR family transcriptional regulator [Streptomyces griseorubiginosus]|uniref:MerR family transcriptional regulator n=1 Tax=Streptomyces griseorubiginosus TaxID=67304 RepID=UPI0036F09616